MTRDSLFLFLDAHAHLYPRQDPVVAVRALVGHAARFAPGARPAMLLLESRGNPVFRAWRDGAEARFRRCAPQTTDAEGLWFEVAAADGTPVRVYGGTQIRCAGRLEVVAAFRLLPEVEDGVSLAEAVRAVLERDALAVLPWGAGKWWGPRARPVLDVLRSRDPGRVLLSDSALRPRGGLWPRPFRAARRQGFGVLAGSDPLPGAGEAGHTGCYGSRLPVGKDARLTVRELSALLVERPPAWRNVGRRCGPAGFFLRQGAGFLGKRRLPA